jgi:beta-N-acetylhexosaminidase
MPLSCYGQSLRSITRSDINSVKEIVGKMSLEEKLGQMFIIGFDKERLPNEITNLITKYNIGGVVYYHYNLPDQRPPGGKTFANNISRHVADLSNSLQVMASKKPGSKIPLFISVDQENGSARVIERDVTQFPNNISFGNARNKKLTKEAGKIVGSELKAIGINMNFAPVVDVNTNNKNDIIGPRAFGGNKELVTALGVEFMKGLQEGGILSVGKHYPGHGDTSGDPRNSSILPKINNEISHIEQFMIPPFRALIENGVDALMTAHMIVPALGTQEGLPVSLSYDVINNLRTKYNFNGVVVTDDITAMISITDNYKVEDAARLALEAGNDIVLLATLHPHTPSFTYDRFVNFINKTIEDIKSSKIKLNESQINQSVERILLLKKKLNSDFNADKWLVSVDSLDKSLRKPESLKTAKEISDKSIVLVTENGKPVSSINNTIFNVSAPLKKLPVSGVNSNKLLVVTSVFYPPDYLFDSLTEIGNHKFENIKLIYGYEKEPNSPECKRNWGTQCLNLISEKLKLQVVNNIVSKVYSSNINKDAPIIFSVVNNLHVEVLRSVLNKVKDRKFIVIALRTAYLIDDDIISNANVTIISSGSGIETSLKSVVDVLYGNLSPHPINYLSVSIGKNGEIANRSIDIGAPIEDDINTYNKPYKHNLNTNSNHFNSLLPIITILIAIVINYYFNKKISLFTYNPFKYSSIVFPLLTGGLLCTLLRMNATSSLINVMLCKYDLAVIVEARYYLDLVLILVLASISTPLIKLLLKRLRDMFKDKDDSENQTSPQCS